MTTKSFMMRMVLVLGLLAFGAPLQAAVAKKPAKKVQKKRTAGPFLGYGPTAKSKAAAAEDEGDWRKAWVYWNIVQQVEGDKKSPAKIKEMEDNIKDEVATALKAGAAALAAGNIGGARRAYLTVLSYDPKNGEAMSALSKKMAPDEITDYEVRKGETLAAIATKIYGDAGQADMIAYINGFKPKVQPKPGSKIKLLGAGYSGNWPDSAAKNMARARSLSGSGKFTEALLTANALLRVDPENAAANDLVTQIYYTEAKQAMAHYNYARAKEVLAILPPGYKDVGKTLRNMNSIILSEAETHYKQGVNAYLGQDFDKAIGEFESALRINPNHDKAKSSLAQVKAEREKIRALK